MARYPLSSEQPDPSNLEKLYIQLLRNISPEFEEVWFSLTLNLI